MLPLEEWLPQAKRLAVGMQDRKYHRNEKRPNLVVGNDADRYWCYCQSCKEGGVQMKEHVKLNVKSPEAKRSDLTLPKDMQRLSALAPELQYPLLAFLASKHMDQVMLPELWYSESRKRLLVDTGGQGWLGRDVTGNALEKWLTYNRTQYLHGCRGNYRAVVVEDPFSFFKVRWAMLDGLDVYCALGTGMKDSLLTALLNYATVWIMFDGDAAGRRGSTAALKRLRGFGRVAEHINTPLGFDPKDLTAAEIQQLLGD